MCEWACVRERACVCVSVRDSVCERECVIQSMCECDGEGFV